MSGSTAERLLHGTGCPVAVAPRGYRRRHPSRCGGSASPSSTRRTATRPSGHAADLAAGSGLPLTLYSVVGLHVNWFVPEAVRPDEGGARGGAARPVPRRPRPGLAGLPDGVQATGELLFGEVVDELSVVGERGVDLLVCGSRGYGPVRRVLLGTVSSALVRQASVPILVVPRGGA